MDIFKLNEWRVKTNYTPLEIKLYILESLRINEKTKIKVQYLYDKFNLDSYSLEHIIKDINKCFDVEQVVIGEKELFIQINTQMEFEFMEHPEFFPIWNEFMSLRKKKKASQTERAIRSLLTRIQSFSNNNADMAIKIIERSCDMGWKDVFPLKEEKETNNVNKNLNAYIQRTWNQ